MALRLIPFAITLIIALDKLPYIKSVIRKITAVLSVGILDAAFSIGAYVLSHSLILEKPLENSLEDIDHTIEMIARVWYSYQDYKYVGASYLLCVLFAILLGYLLGLLTCAFLTKGERTNVNLRSLCSRNRLLTIAGCVFSLCLSITLLYKGFTGVYHLVINEVCSNNFSTPINEEYDVCDYIEIYNVGEHACVTDGLYVSDDEDEPFKLAVDEYTMTNFGRAVISLKDAPFGISKDGGEIVYLFDGVGNIIDSVKVAGTESDKSYSRIVDGANEWVVTGCTPGRANETSIDKIPAPRFSAEAGFYEDEFDLTLATDGNVSIYYTLDGSMPSMDSALYEGPIHVYDRSSEENKCRSLVNVVEDWQDGHYVPDITPVDKAFIVRAVAIADDRHISDVVTKTYFVNLDKYKKYPVISIVGSPNELFGDNGIYVTGTEYDEWVAAGKPGDYVYPNFCRRGRANEAKVSLEYFANDESAGANDFTQYAGLRIRGNSSDGRVLKPFSVFARKDYAGSRYFPDEILGTKMTHSFAIRGGYANTVYPDMVAGRDVATHSSRLKVLFINGEFWYTTAAMEKLNKDFFAEHYGVDKDNVIIMQDTVLAEGRTDEEYIYDDIDAYLQELDFTKDEDYQDFCSKFDIQSYIDLMCINLYIANTDRIDFSQNDILWRVREPGKGEYEDGRWRWCLYDLDACDNYEKGPREKIDSTVELMNQPLFARLIENDDFKKRFISNFVEIADTCFDMSNVNCVMNSYDVEDYALKHYTESVDGSFEDHKKFFENRREYIFKYVEEAFGVELEKK